MGDDSPPGLVLFLISLGLLGAFVLVLWAINAVKARLIMSRSQPASAPDRAAELVQVPIPATSTAQGTTAAAPSGTVGAAPDTHGPNAGTEAWEMPRISRRLSDQDMIALLAVQRTSAGKLRYSANQIAHTLQRQKQAEGPSKLVLAPPKTARSVRIVPMPLFVEQALARHLERQQQERQKAGASWIDNGLVFCTPHGTPIDPRNLLREFKALLERAELPDMRPHDLRHSCATLLIAKGVHPRIVMDVLGHSQISITMNTYGHVTAEAQRSAAQAMDGLFLEAPHDEKEG
jgi:Phage integrase family